MWDKQVGSVGYEEWGGLAYPTCMQVGLAYPTCRQVGSVGYEEWDSSYSGLSHM